MYLYHIMFTYIILFLVLYFLYRFIVGFVLPVVNASQKLQQKMRDINEQQTGEYTTTDNDINIKRPTQTRRQANEAKPSSKDYIEFEEVK